MSDAAEIICCPICSVVPNRMVQPQIIPLQRSKLFLLQAPLGCDHVFKDATGADKARLVETWNSWAASEAVMKARRLFQDESQVKSYLDKIGVPKEQQPVDF